MNGYKTAEQLLRQQNSTKAHEAQLLDARKQRKETDGQLQAMMNRIAFLAQEELRLDRDIEAARRKAAEALARQATRDHDIAATARDVLAVMPAATTPRLVRPHTGRSSLFASLSEGAAAASTSALASTSPSPRTPMTSQRSSKSLNSDVGGAGGVSAPSAPPPGALGHPPRAPSASRARPPAVLAGRGSDKANKLPPVAPPSATATGASTIRSASPGAPRPTSASRLGTASRSLSSSPPSSISPTNSASEADGAAAAAAVATTSARRHSADVPSIAAAAATATLPHSRSASGKSSSRPAVAATATAEEDGRVLLSGASTGPLAASLLSLSSSSSSGPNHIAGLQQLSGTQQYSTDSDLAQGLGGSGGAAAGRSGAMTLIHGGSELAAAELPTALSSGGSGGAAYSGRNTMTVIHGAAQAAGELDGEVIEELQRGGRSGGGGTGGNGGEGPSGLQEFATESGRKVVVVKASRKPEGTAAATAVSAAGVGWGMGGRSAGGAAPIAPLEARQLQAEMAKKQQIWKVRKTFGLEPTPLSDRSAQVEELGAGAWQ